MVKLRLLDGPGGVVVESVSQSVVHVLCFNREREQEKLDCKAFWTSGRCIMSFFFSSFVEGRG